MNKVYIGVPLVMERLVLPTIKTILGDVEAETIRWTVDLNRFTGLDPLPLAESDIFELIATHHVSHLQDRDRIAVSGNYACIRDAFPPMREELATQGFDDPTGYFVTFSLVPVTIIYNSSLQSPPRSWEELAEPRWQGRVVTFDGEVIYKLLKIGMGDIIGDRTEEFVESVLYSGNPVNVNHEIDSGRADVGIMPLPFATASRQGNVRLQWPEEGAFVVPNIMAFKKNPDQRAIDIGKYLLSDGVQRMMSSLGVIPVNPSVQLPEQVVVNKPMNLRWNGWAGFIEALNRQQIP